MSWRPSRARRAAAFGVAGLVVCGLVLSAPAIAKFFDSIVGSTSGNPALGGTFNTPRDVAVNDPSIADGNPTANGDYYVVDEVNHRIQRFNADDSFDRAWGWNVIQPGGTGEQGDPQNEVQTVTLGSQFVPVTGGTFTLSFDPGGGAQVTGSIPYNASADAVETALVDDLAALDAGDVEVTSTNPGGGTPAGGPFRVEFTGDFAGVNVAQMTQGPGTSLTTPFPTTPGSVSVATTANGGLSPAYEVCTVASQCQAGVATGEGGAMDNPQGVAVDQDTGNVYVSDRDNRRVSQYTADGEFVRSFGWDVVAPGSPGGSDVNEQQRITLDPNADGGTFTLTFGSTAPATTTAISANASAGDVEAALGALGGIGGTANVDVTGPNGGPWTVEFVGALADRNVAQISVTASTVALTARVGAQLTCSSTTNAANTTFGWLTDGAPSTGPGADTATYTTVADDAGKPVQCQVTKSNANAGGTQVSNSPIVVTPAPGTAPPVAPGSISAPSQSGSIEAPGPSVDRTLTCTTGTWTGATNPFQFQWYKNGVAISGAIASTYVVAAGSLAAPASFQCAVTGSNAGGAVTKVSGNRTTSPSPSSPSTPNVNATVPALGVTPSTIVDGSSGYEVCEAADGDVCQAGVGADNGAGANPGQYSAGSVTHGYRIDVSKPDGDTAAGKVYLANTGSRRVESFDLDGASPTNFGREGDFGSSQPVSVAVDGDGLVYATTGGASAPLARYDTATDEFRDPPIDIAGLAGNASRNGLEVDRRTGNLFVTSSNDSAGILEIANPSATPVLAGRYPTQTPATFTPLGIGLNPDTGRVFLPSTSPSPHKVIVFDDDGISPMDISLQPATNIGARTADLHATINPSPDGPTGSPASYRFEVSKNGVDWTQVTPETLVPPDGDTDADAEVDAHATGLEPNTEYRVRVVATRVNNHGRGVSSELFFTTDPAPPVVQTIAAQHVTDRTAQIVGRVNPGGLTTEYWFEWGDDSYGNRAPAGASGSASGGVAVGVIETLSGLDSGAVYHFRLCATNSLAPAGVCGADRTFTTLAPVATPEGRVYEMVTAADKPLRQGGQGKGGANQPDYARVQGGLASTDGGSLNWVLFPGATDPEAGHRFTWAETYEIYRRTAAGWRGEAVTNVAPPTGGSNAVIEPAGVSEDLDRSAWYTQTPLFARLPGADNGSQQATRVSGDRGGPLLAGWYPWLHPAYYSGSMAASTNWTVSLAPSDTLLGWSALPPVAVGATRFLAVSPLDGGGAPTALNPPQSAGLPLFLSDAAHQWAPTDLVNECTGSVPSTPEGSGDATQLPARVGTGASSDTIGARNCPEGSPTDVRGARIGGARDLPGSSVTAMSDDGRRVFFLSPDPNLGAAALTDQYCGSGTGSSTACPAQLFVRQFDDQGDATVRWLSRAEDALFDAPQAIGLAGNGVAFEGASRDGSVVYFRTNAPLTTDDPNGGTQLSDGHVAGTASPNSWDLYRYELGEDSSFDPAPVEGDPGSRLTRVSGGPSGDSDPNTNCFTVATAGHQAGNCWGSTDSGDSPAADKPPNGNGTTVRFMSDDGDRVYFVTAAGIPGASNEPPINGATTPTAADAQVNSSDRNLYLYDADKTGATAYEFVARLPFSTDTGAGRSIDSCASFATGQFGSPHVSEAGNLTRNLAFGNCIHGSSSGDAIVFESAAQLTDDDQDAAIDVYVYDAASDRLSRASAPHPGSSPYACQSTAAGGGALIVARCNGDLGATGQRATSGQPASPEQVGTSGMRHWNVAEHPDGTLKAIYFETRLALIPDDVNGAGEMPDTGGEGVMDVYEWRRNGQLDLISPGDQPHSAFYSGNGRSGQDVFFWTEQRISPWEIDVADGDMYNATTRPDRLPDPPPLSPVCAVLSDACQDGGAGALAVDPRTSPSGPPVADDPVSERQTLSVSKPGRKARRRAARTGRLTISVRTSEAGLVRVGARARFGRKLVKVGGARKRVAAAGVTKVSLRLNARARRALRRGRALRVTLKVAQAGARTRSATVNLERGPRR